MKTAVLVAIALAGCARSAPVMVEVITRGTHPVCRGAGEPLRSRNVFLRCPDGLEVLAPWERVERTGPRSGVVDLP